MRLVIDTGYLNRLCHPKFHPEMAAWFQQQLADDAEFVAIVPDIIDYELRRGYLYSARYERDRQKKQRFVESLDRLDQLIKGFEYARITASILRHAAQLWADARGRHQATADEKSLDIDVILASFAHDLGAEVLTTNERHLARYSVKTLSIGS